MVVIETTPTSGCAHALDSALAKHPPPANLGKATVCGDVFLVELINAMTHAPSPGKERGWGRAHDSVLYLAT